jgi:hypothetical protein
MKLLTAVVLVIEQSSFFLANLLSVKQGDESNDASSTLSTLAITHFSSPGQPPHYASC